jgi:hypothetical protein
LRRLFGDSVVPLALRVDGVFVTFLGVFSSIFVLAKLLFVHFRFQSFPFCALDSVFSVPLKNFGQGYNLKVAILFTFSELLTTFGRQCAALL